MPAKISADRIVGRQLRFSAVHLFPVGEGQALRFIVKEKLQSDTFLFNPDFWERFAHIRNETFEWKEKFPIPGRLGALGLKKEVVLGEFPIFDWPRVGYVRKVGKYYVWYHVDHRFYIVLDSTHDEMDLYIFMDKEHPLQLELEKELNYSVMQISDEFARLIGKASQVCPSNGPTLCI